MDFWYFQWQALIKSSCTNLQIFSVCLSFVNFWHNLKFPSHIRKSPQSSLPLFLLIFLLISELLRSIPLELMILQFDSCIFRLLEPVTFPILQTRIQICDMKWIKYSFCTSNLNFPSSVLLLSCKLKWPFTHTPGSPSLD